MNSADDALIKACVNAALAEALRDGQIYLRAAGHEGNAEVEAYLRTVQERMAEHYEQEASNLLDTVAQASNPVDSGH